MLRLYIGRVRALIEREYSVSHLNEVQIYLCSSVFICGSLFLCVPYSGLQTAIVQDIHS
jgi:hypothetical protein